MPRAAANAVLAIVAVVLQVTVVDRLPLPGGGVPDIALLLVVMLGLAHGPVAGALTGFIAGVALDLAPPASHLIGGSALIFCVVGYACGRVSAWVGDAPLRLLAAAAIATSGGEALQAILGAAFGDPDVTPRAVGQVLPAAVAYDLLVCLFAAGMLALSRRRHAIRAQGTRGPSRELRHERRPRLRTRRGDPAIAAGPRRRVRGGRVRLGSSGLHAGNGALPRRFGRRAGLGHQPPRQAGRLQVRRDRADVHRYFTAARPSRMRLVAAFAVCGALLVALAGRLWYVQVGTGRAYASLARQEQVRAILVPPARGQILDDTGRALVASRPEIAITVNKAVLAAQSDGGSAELRRLAVLAGIGEQLLRDRLRLCTAGVSQPCWAGSPYQPIPVMRQVPERVGVQIMEDHRELPGVTATEQPVVAYPQGASAAQMLGYLQPITPQEERQLHLPLAGPADAELVGQSGLEAQYDAALRGTAGVRHVVVNAAGDVTAIARSAGNSRPMPGSDLVTSINAQVQADAEHALAHAVRKAHSEGNLGATTGAAVVMTTSGRVIAMASYPSYHPGTWTRGITERQYRRLFGVADGEPILNRAIQGAYAPGSTWKVTSAAAAVAAGYSLAGPYDCPGSVSIGGRTFYNDNPFNSGAMSLHEALVVSCDTVFYQLAYDIWLRDARKADVVTSARAPVQEMQRMEVAWGFGKATGIDLPGESAGTVPTRAWLYAFYRQNKRAWCRQGRQYGSYLQQIAYQDCRYGNVWEPGQAADAAIGQGYVTVTPLQLARAYAALANGGTLYSPRIGEALIRPNGRVVRKITPPVVGHIPVSAGVLAYIRNALADAVTQGTAAPAFAGFPLSRVCVAGKTGTAQVAGKDATSVFASYAPCAHPRYVVVMMIPESGYGADVSAPAVRQIWDGIYGLEGHRAALPGGRLPTVIPSPARPRPAPRAGVSWSAG